MPRPQQPQRKAGPNSLVTTAAVQIAAAAEENGKRVRRLTLVAYTGEPLAQRWSDAPIVVDLSGVTAPARLPILFDHGTYDPDDVIGQSDGIEVGNGQIVARGQMMGNGKRRLQVEALADDGYQWQVSIGADVQGSMEFIGENESVTVNGRSYAGPVRVARKIQLREVSFVSLGADKNTSAVVARRQTIKGTAMPTFEEWVTALGFDAATLTDQQRAAMTIAYNQANEEEAEEEATEPQPAGSTPAATSAPAPATATAVLPDIQAGIQAQRQAYALEANRVAGIRRICASNPTMTIPRTATVPARTLPIEAHAIAEGWDETRTELEVLRAARPSGPGLISRDRDVNVDTLQAAMILRANGRLDHPSYTTPRAVAMGLPQWLRAGLNTDQRQRVMEAAYRLSAMSMIDLCRECVRIDGREVPQNRDLLIQAATSGGSLTNIFTTNINTILLATYAEAGDTTAEWTQTTDVADFKTNERPRLTKGPGLSKLPRGGEADHASRSDVMESYRIARYAKQFVIDDQDIIDDHFNALSDMPTEMGLAAARLRPDLVYSILLANPTLSATAAALFNTTTGTVNKKTTAALTSTTLKAAIQLMMLQQENSVNLNLMPTHLITPVTLRNTGAELINSSQILVAPTTTERGNLNTIAADGLKLIADARLENGVTDPNSGTAYSGSSSTWYLACAMAHTIEVAYLRGTGRAPQVRNFILAQGKYGIGWDVKMDIGAKAMDWRGMVQNTA